MVYVMLAGLGDGSPTPFVVTVVVVEMTVPELTSTRSSLALVNETMLVAADATGAASRIGSAGSSIFANRSLFGIFIFVLIGVYCFFRGRLACQTRSPGIGLSCTPLKLSESMP